MDGMIKDLVGVIKQEEELLDRFLVLLEEQKQILIKNDIEAFEETAARQEDLIIAIQDLENERVKIVQSVANDTGQQESEMTMTRMVEMNLGQVSDELADAKKNMNGLVKRIKKVSSVNQYLIKRSLNRAERNIGWLIDDGDQAVTYQPDGKIRNRETRAVLVNRTL